jgi:hypothetical protein
MFTSTPYASLCYCIRILHLTRCQTECTYSSLYIPPDRSHTPIAFSLRSRHDAVAVVPRSGTLFVRNIPTRLDKVVKDKDMIWESGRIKVRVGESENKTQTGKRRLMNRQPARKAMTCVRARNNTGVGYKGCRSTRRKSLQVVNDGLERACH